MDVRFNAENDRSLTALVAGITRRSFANTTTWGRKRFWPWLMFWKKETTYFHYLETQIFKLSV